MSHEKRDCCTIKRQTRLLRFSSLPLLSPLYTQWKDFSERVINSFKHGPPQRFNQSQPH